MAGRYISRATPTLGDVSLSVPAIDVQQIDFSPSDLLTNPWVWAVGGLLLYVLYEMTPTVSGERGGLRISKRKKAQTGVASTIAIAIGSALAAYLLAQMNSGNQAASS